MANVGLLQIGSFPDWDQDPLNATYEIVHYKSEQDLRQMGDMLSQIRAIAARPELGVPRTVMAALPKLEIISVCGVGYDGVDLEAAREHNLRVTNTPDVLSKDVADFAIAMMLVHTRQMLGASSWTRSGKWAGSGPYPLTGRVHGKRAGILGLGRIGYEIGRRLAGFDMNIAYTSRNPKSQGKDWQFFEDPKELAAYSDFLFVALAATAETRHIVGQEILDALGPEGMLINISRAANIDELALLEALEQKTIGGAAIDVFDGEPNLNPRFLQLDNVLLQPHHASATVETRQAMGQLMRDNLTAHFEGKPLLTPVL